MKPVGLVTEFSVCLALAILLISGCSAVGPDYSPPEVRVPETWQETGKSYPFLVPEQTQIRDWWTVFDDPMLNRLIQEAGTGNYDVRVAIARVGEARALEGVVTGEKYPSLELPGSAIRQGTSENGIVPGGQTYTDYNLGFTASWEIDVFGRIRRSIEAAKADYQASEEDRASVLIAVYAEVARTYFAVRTAQARLEASTRNIETQRQIVDLTRTRFKFGLASDLDVAQSEQVLVESEAAVPLIRADLDRNAYILAVLLGRSPGDLVADLSEVKPIPVPAKQVAVGVPLNLLRQRPDIRSTERQLAAQTARIGVATAELYPRFSLLGALGLASISTGNFFEGSSVAWQAGGSLGWKLFAGGSLRSQIKVEDARAMQALLHYEKAILTAVNEVENALVTYAEDQKRLGYLERSVTIAERTLRLSLELYKDGLSDFQSTLDAERTLFISENNAAQAEGNTAASLVNLYEALGGGWNPGMQPNAPAGK